MARQLTQTLTKINNSYPKPPYSLSSITNLSHKSQFIEIELDSSSSASSPSAGLQQLEDAIHGIIVRRLQPDWLPFRPGSSYWVPPRRSVSDNLAHLVGKLNHNPLTREQSLALVSANGWPSSSFFIDDQGSPPTVEVHMYSQKLEYDEPLSEDED